MFGWLSRKEQRYRQKVAQEIQNIAMYIDDSRNNYIGDYGGILWELSTVIKQGQPLDAKRILEAWRFKLPMTVARPSALTVVKGGKGT